MLLVHSSEAVPTVDGHIAPTVPDLTATHAQAAVDTAATTVAADGHLAPCAFDLSETPSQPPGGTRFTKRGSTCFPQTLRTPPVL